MQYEKKSVYWPTLVDSSCATVEVEDILIITRQMLQHRGASLRMHADDIDTTKSYTSELANSDILSYVHTLSR